MLHLAYENYEMAKKILLEMDRRTKGIYSEPLWFYNTLKFYREKVPTNHKDAKKAKYAKKNNNAGTSGVGLFAKDRGGVRPRGSTADVKASV